MTPESYDVVILGGTPAGIACAVTLARLGRRVAIAEYHPIVGGMMTGGIGKSDIENHDAIDGVFREFVERVRAYYVKRYGPDAAQVSDCLDGYYYEPSAAEAIFNDMLAEQSEINVLRAHRLDRVRCEDNRIRSIELIDRRSEKRRCLNAKVFIDATYEGDLYAAAGADYRVGRESRDEFEEPHAGRIYLDHETHEVLPGSTGEGDDRIPAYTYRLCLTTDLANAAMLDDEPEGYDRNLYLPYLKDLEDGRLGPPERWIDGRGYYAEHFDTLVRALSVSEIPNGKVDANINPRPLAFPFAQENTGYPQADWPERERIARRHREITLGLLYFLQNDPAVPEAHRALARRYHLPRDEYIENGHMPYQLYIREARRLVGEYVLTEHDVTIANAGRTPVHHDAIACGEFPIDSFPVRKYEPGQERVLEGYLCMVDEVTRPYQIPYRIMLAQGVDGLIVPVAASATHVAFSTIRMEPTWMAMGQAAAVAAHVCLKRSCKPREAPASILQRMLLKQRQVVTYFEDVPADHPARDALQLWGTKGFFCEYRARPDEILTVGEATRWMDLARSALAPTIAVGAGVGADVSPSNEPMESRTDRTPLTGDLLTQWLEETHQLLELPHPHKKSDAWPSRDDVITRAVFCQALFDQFEHVDF